MASPAGSRATQGPFAHPLVGVRAVVTTSIPPGGLGEVRVPHRGGTETYGAYCAIAGVVVPAGTRVSAVEVLPPRGH